MGRDGGTRSVGAAYEERACAYLVSNGYGILARNFSMRGGELDIVAKKDGLIVFVEVRYRADDAHGDPLETVTPRKIRRVCKTAQYYLVKNGYPGDVPVRFDVIAVNGEKLNHIENAFEFTL